jgi:hypothetical protein
MTSTLDVHQGGGKSEVRNPVFRDSDGNIYGRYEEWETMPGLEPGYLVNGVFEAAGNIITKHGSIILKPLLDNSDAVVEGVRGGFEDEYNPASTVTKRRVQSRLADAG